jgi:hypothetical protein
MIDHISLLPDDGGMHQWMQTLYPGEYGGIEAFRDSACSWQIRKRCTGVIGWRGVVLIDGSVAWVWVQALCARALRDAVPESRTRQFLSCTRATTVHTVEKLRASLSKDSGGFLDFTQQRPGDNAFPKDGFELQ